MQSPVGVAWTLRPGVANVETDELGASESQAQPFLSTAPSVWLLGGSSALVHRTISDHTDSVRRVSSAGRLWLQIGLTGSRHSSPPSRPSERVS